MSDPASPDHLPGGHGPEHIEREQHGVDPHPQADHHGGVGKYLLVFAALCVLTGASFFTYSEYWPFDKHVAWAFMMAVSCTKAMLVIMFFMHLLWEANWKWVLTIPASFMSVFLMLMLVPDIGWRKYYYSEERRVYAADPPAVEASEEDAAERERSHGAAH